MSYSPDTPAPLSPLEFYVLLSLTFGSAHPYKIKTLIWKHSLGALKPPDGTIYPLITRLCDQGLIDPAGLEPAGRSGRLRQHYAINHHGHAALRHDLERQEYAVALAQTAGLLSQPALTALDLLLRQLEIGADGSQLIP